MQFKKVIINNFLSFGANTTVDLVNRGVVFVAGENKDTAGSNGSGKSAIFEAIMWTLFGDTIRGCDSVNDVVNDIIGKNCFCSVEIDNSTITRYRKHDVHGNDLKFIKDGIDKTSSDVKRTQKEINRTFNLDMHSFVNSIVLSPDNKTGFLDSKNTAFRRNVIESILGIDLYKNYLIATRECMKNFENQKTNLTNSIENYKTQIQQYRSKISEISVKREEFSRSVELKKNNINATLEKLKSIDVNKQLKIYEHIKKAHEILSQLNSKLLAINRDNMISNAEIDSSKKQLEKYKNLTVRACEYCGSILDANNIGNIINPIEINVSRLQEKVKENINQYSEIKAQYASIEKSIEKFKPDLAERELFVIDANIKNLTATLEEISTQKNPYESIDFNKDIEKLDSEITICGEHIKSINDEINHYKFWESGFGNTGLKTYIINDTIEFFNKRIEYYLDILSRGTIKLKFDKFLEFTVSGLKYSNCSQGEKKRVNLAALLALHDLNNIRHNCESNILILDEVLDSVDELGVNCVKDLLIDLSKKISSIFVISHNAALAEYFENIITVVKENRISYIL